MQPGPLMPSAQSQPPSQSMLRAAFLTPATCNLFRKRLLPTSALLQPWTQASSVRSELRNFRRIVRVSPSLRSSPRPALDNSGSNFGNNSDGTGRFGGGGDSGPYGELYASNPDFERLATKSSDAPILARVVSYNVLSPPLASPSHFRHCDPADLDASVRLERVLSKLEGPVASRSIICLQEISLSWCGPLHAFFARRGFHMITGSYGSYFSGYMGVGLAFPVDLYDALDVKVERISDMVSWPKRKRKEGLEKLFSGMQQAVGNVVSFLVGESENDKRRKRSPWIQSQEKKNMMVFARLRSKTNGAQLCVGTYHMPCAFWSPPIMLIHSALVVSQFQSLCGSDKAVLCGDFNIKPGDSAYQMITTGSIEPTHAHFPPKAPDGSAATKWFPAKFSAMKSAYKDVIGTEPDFTNFARPGDAPEFIETLDYLFCTPDLDVVDVIRLPDRKAVKGPFPVASQPSDHIMIGATLRLPAAAKKKRNEALLRGTSTR